MSLQCHKKKCAFYLEAKKIITNFAHKIAMDSIKKSIYRLSEAISPSGFESGAITIWRELIEPYVDGFVNSTLGDGVAVLNGDTSKAIMLIAHADEVGLIISRIDLIKRIAYFDEIGGINTKLLVGRHIKVVNANGEIIVGIIGCQPIHCQPRNSQSDAGRLDPSDLWIDFGENIEKVGLGDYGVIDSSFAEIGDTLSGRGLDDRAGLAVMIEVARLLQGSDVNSQIYFVASTMEELGARGARTVATVLCPLRCIVVDVSIATDTPFHNQANSSDIELGKGATIVVGPNIDRHMSTHLQLIASQKSLPTQLEVCGRPTGTDANPIQITQNGIPCALVGIPCRYMHSPVETINVADIKAAAELIYHYLLTI